MLVDMSCCRPMHSRLLDCFPSCLPINPFASDEHNFLVLSSGLLAAAEGERYPVLHWYCSLSIVFHGS
jgi:hypothetical protein